MFRHVALFRFTPESTPEQRQAMTDALRALPAQIPELRDYHVGPDAGLVDGNWDYAVVAECDDEAGWRAYTDHPAHQRALIDIIRPIMAERAAVQYEG
jgi:hypothetical protein